MENQTQESWLVNVKPGDKGTGLYLYEGDIPKPESPFATDTISIEPNMYKAAQKAVTYTDSLIFANSYKEMVAFKWIPEFVASYDTVRASLTSCTGNVYCVQRCAGYGCLCKDGICK